VNDNGSAKRPRDHRLIHLLLASHGISAYQERVPLQLMDFAYRYISSVLSDAVHVQAEGYDQASASTDAHGRGRGAGRGAGSSARAAATGVEEGDVSLSALRMAIASRMSYQFQGSLPKDFLKGLAEERNRIGLGVGLREQGTVIGGVRLPAEKYCLTGVGWGLKEEWDSEGEEEVEGEDPEGGNVDMAQVDRAGGGGEEDDDEGDDGMGTMEDVFGDEAGGGDGGGGGEDEEMGDS
jgi:transcription initiation factor TFIID subunit 9B